ncbi:hypothetical protein ACJZ2D_009110 [Fusarium nematophilum]
MKMKLSRSTGLLAHGVEQFVEPVPPPNIVHQWLQATRPWTIRNDFVSGDPDEMHLSPQGEATSFWDLVKIHVSRSEVDGDPGIMATQTNWAKVALRLTAHTPPSTSTVCPAAWARSTGSSRPSFASISSSQPGLIAAARQTFDKPHVIGFVSDKQSIQDDLISTSELTSLLFAGTDTGFKESYREKHRIVLVTLVSGSFRSFRVVQAVFDFQTGSIKIRKSRAVDFYNGVMANRHEYLTLLGRILGRPVGKTT